jgi:hypothetical protein
MKRARALTPAEARQLAADLQKSPQDEDAFWTLVRHYEHHGNVRDLNALRLWYIEYEPAGNISPGNIDPHLDRSAWERGRVLWLQHVKGCRATADMVERAADFLAAGDKPLAEKLLQNCLDVFADPQRWARALGRHYAQTLLGSTAPLTEYNVLRATSADEAHTPYAQRVLAGLRSSTDASVAAFTAQHLLAWSHGDAAAFSLARSLVELALAIEPDSEPARGMKVHLTIAEQARRQFQLVGLSPAQRAELSPGDQMLLALALMRESWMNRNPGEAAAKARELLVLARKNPHDALYGDAVFDGNIILGKAALRRGHVKDAARHLLAASDTPGSERLRRGQFELNLPRAIIDAGERETAAQFLERMAAKTIRSTQFQEWAAEIRKGINPDLIPTMSYPGCSNDPC